VSGILIEKSKWLALWYTKTKKLEKRQKGGKKKRGKPRKFKLWCYLIVVTNTKVLNSPFTY